MEGNDLFIMKQNIIYILFAILGFTSCGKNNDLNSLSAGYLSIANIEYEPGIFSEVPTRVIDETFVVELWKGGELLRELTPDEMQNKINLDAATDYSLKVYSSNYGSDISWTNDMKGEPIYYIEVPFEVEEGKVTGLNIKVPMTNFGVSLNMPEIAGASWLKGYTFNVTVGERQVELLNGETAYFSYSDGIQFSYVLSMTNTDDETNELDGVWGDSGEESINRNTIYTVTYNWETHSLSLR